ncbi:hypothetical protein ABPG73_008084 [Tetrahymena malaccensis]
MVYFLKGDTQIIGQMMDLNLLQANQIYQLEQFAYDREGTDTTVKVQFNVFYRIQPSNYKVIQYTSWENLVLKVNGIQLVDFGFIKTSSKNSVATADGLLYKQQMHRFFESWGANHFFGGNCISCYKSCKTCFGAKNDQCQECYENYQINKNICYQFQLSIESKEFPQSKVESIQKLSQSTSSALVISSSIMNSFQSIGSNSSFGILISSLTIQKLTYLYILNILLPLQIGSVLEILSVNVAEYSSHIEKISYTFLVNVQFVQLIQPIYMIIILSVSVYDLIRKRMVSRVLQQQDSQIDVDNFNSLNLTNINQELVNQKNVSLRIVQIFKKSKKSDSEYQDQKIKNTQYKID